MTKQIEAILAACKANASEIAAALSRTFDADFAIEINQPVSLEQVAWDALWAGSALAVVLTTGDQAAVVAIPVASGLVPSWCAAPDPTGVSKLTTLAQELGLLVLPDDLPADDFQAAQLDGFVERLRSANPGAEASVVPIALLQGGRSSEARLIWPVADPLKLFSVDSPASPASTSSVEKQPKDPASQPAAECANTTTAPRNVQYAPSSQSRSVGGKLPQSHRPRRLEELPPYTRSLLKIRVPVIVTLAERRQPLKKIIELGPGSIIQFDKSCDETLDLQVGDHRIAVGEAVKVGDKFGLRITSMTLPEERFEPIRPDGATRRK